MVMWIFQLLHNFREIQDSQYSKKTNARFPKNMGKTLFTFCYDEILDIPGGIF